MKDSVTEYDFSQMMHAEPELVAPPDSDRWIDEHGDYLYQFALVRVRNPDVAEDLVQETFLAALKGTPRESGPMAERRWMIGIIKHKIVDHFRRIRREPLHHDENGPASLPDDEFVADGHWKQEAASVRNWPNGPDGLLERKQFWDSLERCLGKLPPRTAQVFMLREIDELETEEICHLLRLTPTNLGVLLHRARKQLRNCLSAQYFGREEEVPSS
ncbi:MAG: sigma-70 family RNA polymerase sigma factor [Nitrospira sp.]|nr:sigma-70 family RNA polymerase sigma factor [Nitrospira sp.]